MSSLFKGTAFFEDITGYGWSENYFIIEGDQASALAAMQTMLPLRLALLPTTDSCTYLRVSTQGKPPDSLVGLPTTGGNGTYTIGSSQNPMPADVCALVTFVSLPTLKNRKF